MRLQESMLFIVDLSQITGKGVFQCPKCGAKISPDDKTEKRYAIIETTMNGLDLDKVNLQCKKCGSVIQLRGFQILKSLR